jgi:O-antigen ligase
MLGGGVLLAACSERVRGRALETLQAVHPTAPAPAPDAANSTNLRLALLHSGVVVAREHWALGVGWARYPDAFAQASANTPVGDVLRKWLNPNNPHTEYLLQLGAGGLPALLLFLAWLAAPVWLALRHRRLESPWAGAAGCIAIAFALSALFNSVLRDFVEAHFYTSLMAWLLVRRVND